MTAARMAIRTPAAGCAAAIDHFHTSLVARPAAAR
jgi:hypothetical protein